MFSLLNCNNVNIKRIYGFDSYAKPLQEEIENIACKIEFSNKKILDRNGDMVVSTGTIRTEEYLGINDEIEINGEYVPFIQIQPQTSFSGKIEYWIGWF